VGNTFGTRAPLSAKLRHGLSPNGCRWRSTHFAATAFPPPCRTTSPSRPQSLLRVSKILRPPSMAVSAPATRAALVSMPIVNNRPPPPPDPMTIWDLLSELAAGLFLPAQEEEEEEGVVVVVHLQLRLLGRK
jgi:hypothetical protein